MDTKFEENEVALSALGTGISFLKKCMLDDKIIKLSTYIKVNQDFKFSNRMIIDAQALENL